MRLVGFGFKSSIWEVYGHFRSTSMTRHLRVCPNFVLGPRSRNERRLAVTAEGIESEDQFQRLKNAGANFAQGFHLGEPVPALQFIAEYLRSPVLNDRSALRRVN
jgi:hypothetical protein